MSLQEYAVEKAKDYKINPLKFKKLIQCESGWNDNVYGDSGLAYGLLQFHKDTFDLFSKTYKLNLDYKNPYDQIDLAAKMIHDNYSYHWTCAKLSGF